MLFITLKYKTGMWIYYENTCQPRAKYFYINR